MRYPPNFLDEIRARLSVSQVVGRKVALKRAGREFKGLSPFKMEKTPSCFAPGDRLSCCVPQIAVAARSSFTPG